MILTELLSQQWKSFTRGRSKGQTIAAQLIKGFFLFYILTVAILLGISLEDIVRQGFPSQDVVATFYGFIFYYFIADIIIRYLFQSLPSLRVKPYLVQNIRRTTLIRFFDICSLFTVFNLLPFVLFFPFATSAIAAKYDMTATFFFLLSVFGLSIGNHFLVVYAKRKAFTNNRTVVIFLLLLAGIIAADWFQFFSLRDLSAQFFFKQIQHSWLTIICLVWMAFHYYNNYFFQRREFYITENSKSRGSSSALFWLPQGGLITELAVLELKMILRNKRPRSLFVMSWFFLLYGFIIFKEKNFDDGFGMPLVGAFAIIGMFVVNYGQFFFAWQSIHFDGLFAGNMQGKLYVKSKFRLIALVCTVMFLISLLYVLIDFRAIYVLLSGYFFCIGVVPVLMFVLACYNFKYLDISESSSFNYQGTGTIHWVAAIILFLIGAIIYFPFSIAYTSRAGVWAIGIAGLISLLLQDWWIATLYKQFDKNKYKILEGFRER